MDSSSISDSSELDTSDDDSTLSYEYESDSSNSEKLGGATADDLTQKSLYWRKNEKGITKESRATIEQVLDRRSLYRLSKIAKRGVFTRLYGVISTGKEANVYEAIGDNGVKLAVKVYKTSILVFKDRSKYIQGEFRFRRGYMGNKNPRKMVKQWAEKEYRNLRRIIISGVRCPSPVTLLDHILVMQQITCDNNNVALRLHDYKNVNQYIYSQIICIMRHLYNKCKLIHGDFSEYNLLIGSDNLVYVIDVSQAVEHDHIEALRFLKRDCININNYFKRFPEIKILSNRLLFHFITEGDNTPLIKTLINTDVSSISTILPDSEPESIKYIVQLMEIQTKSHDRERSCADPNQDLIQKLLQNRKAFNLLVHKFMEWDIPADDYYKSDDLEGLMLPTQLGQLSTLLVERLKIDETLPSFKDINSNDTFNDEDVENDYIINRKAPDTFTGIIPPNIDRKEWKKLVKVLQREQRIIKKQKKLKKKK